MHRELSRLALDYSIKRLCIKAPRGSAKTTLLATLLPIHYILYQERPQTILIVSATQDQASLTLDAIKALTTQTLFQQIYGNIGSPETSRRWTTDEATFRSDSCIIMARGLNQQLRGIHYRNQRPTLIILDDPDDEETAKSQTLLETHWRRLTKELLPALDPQHGRIIVIGTPVHQLCIVERLKDEKSWTYRHYKALIEVEGADPSWPPSQRYTSYWPQWHTTSRLITDMQNAKRKGRLSEWWSEYMCELIGDESAPFRQEMINYWEGTVKREENNAFITGKRLDTDENIYLPCTITMGIDPAATTNATSDFTGIVVLAQSPDKKFFILHTTHVKAKPIEAAQLIINLYDHYKPHRVIVETQGYQEMLRGYLKEKRPNMPIIGLKAIPGTRKEVRLLGLQPDFAEGRFFLKIDQEELINELLTFPRSAHDDLLDALYYAWRGSFPPTSTLQPDTENSPRKHHYHTDSKPYYYWMLL